MAESFNSLYMRDPAAADRQRRAAQAQALMKAGSDTSSLVGTGNNSMQAIARALQGITGGVMGGMASRDARTAADEAKAESKAATAEFAQLAGIAPPAAPMADNLGGAPNAPAPAPVPQVQQASLGAPSGPTPPPNMYGRNASLVAGRDATLGASPEVLADASQQRSTATNGIPAGTPFRANPGPGGIYAGIPAPSGAVPALASGGGAPAPAAPQQAPGQAGPSRQQIMAFVLKHGDNPNPGVQRQVQLAQALLPVLEQRAQREEARTFRLEERADNRAFQQQGRDEAAAARAEARALAERQFQLAERNARNGRLPQGMEYGPDGQPRRINLPADPNAPYAGSSLDAQNLNILLRGDPGSREYAAAYSQLSAPRANPDGSSVTPNMEAYRRPTFREEGADPTAPEPNYSQPVVVPPRTMNVEQGKVATFADRLAESMPIIEKFTQEGMSLRDRAANALPGGNFFTSPGFQQADQAERNYINAVLRRESGAVISAEEFDNARRQYIPQPGDSPERLAQKKANRETILQGFTREAGPAYRPRVPEAPPEVTTPEPPKMGAVQDGYVFKGGDPSSPGSWERAQ